MIGAETEITYVLKTINRRTNAFVIKAEWLWTRAARQPADYTETRGTLTFEEGDIEHTVPVRADSENEGDETMSLVLSNPIGSYLADAQATGTIKNTAPIPQAWLARFGRTVADQVFDAVHARHNAAHTLGAAATVVGQARHVDDVPGDADGLRGGARMTVGGGEKLWSRVRVRRRRGAARVRFYRLERVVKYKVIEVVHSLHSPTSTNYIKEQAQCHLEHHMYPGVRSY